MRQRISRIKVTAPQKGLSDITPDIKSWMADNGILTGLLCIWCAHTSTSLIVHANADAEVVSDLQNFFDRLVKTDSGSYEHAAQDPENMAAHIRSSLTSSQLTIPVENGALPLGKAQSIYLFEHRSDHRVRELILHFIGECE
ncbi:MAG: secondary thiamine-phosphate synthase enzyme YjbQ [Paracoccaceae bacterium]